MPAPFGTDDADPVAARDADREIPTIARSPKLLLKCLGLDRRARPRYWSASASVMLTCAGHAAAMLASRLPASPSSRPGGGHCACGGRNAVAQPMLLVDDLAVELVLVALLLGQHLVAPGLERGKALVEAAGGAAIEPDGGAGEAGEEPPIMADDDQSRFQRFDLAFQPLDGRQDRDGSWARREAGCRVRARARVRWRRVVPPRPRARPISPRP